MKRTAAVLIASASLVVGGTVAATATSSGATYTGCVSKSTGVLRVLKSGSCSSSKEYPITWNERGPQGPQGAKGSQGAKGPQGVKGPQGPRGYRGTDGTNGTNGTDGTDGKDGKDGAGARVYTGSGASLGGVSGEQELTGSCDDGDTAIGRNFESSVPGRIRVDESYIDNGDSSWKLEFTPDANGGDVSFNVLCLDSSSGA